MKKINLSTLKLSRATTCKACGHTYEHGFCPCGGYGEIETTLCKK